MTKIYLIFPQKYNLHTKELYQQPFYFYICQSVKSMYLKIWTWNLAPVVCFAELAVWLEQHKESTETDLSWLL